MNTRPTLRERWENIVADWSGKPKEIRQTAVGWQPQGKWTYDCGPSGTDEYYRVVRRGNKWSELEKERKNDERI